MPIYEYQTSDGNRFERIFSTWRDAPDELETEDGPAVRVLSAPQINFPDPQIQRMKDKGLVVAEKGVLRDQRRQKKHLQEKRERKRKKFLAEQLSGAAL